MERWSVPRLGGTGHRAFGSKRYGVGVSGGVLRRQHLPSPARREGEGGAQRRVRAAPQERKPRAPSLPLPRRSAAQPSSPCRDLLPPSGGEGGLAAARRQPRSPARHHSSLTLSAAPRLRHPRAVSRRGLAVVFPSGRGDGAPKGAIRMMAAAARAAVEANDIQSLSRVETHRRQTSSVDLRHNTPPTLPEFPSVIRLNENCSTVIAFHISVMSSNRQSRTISVRI